MAALSRRRVGDRSVCPASVFASVLSRIGLASVPASVVPHRSRIGPVPHRSGFVQVEEDSYKVLRLGSLTRKRSASDRPS